MHLKAIFFGGGTASLMPLAHISQVAERLLQQSTDPSNVEVTLECEPGTISRDTLREVKSCGINRISVCAQSFDDRILSLLGRKHDAKDSYRLVEDCVAVGIENIHIDLMYGLPGQSVEDWENTLRVVANLPVHHASAYKLYVYKHGQLHRASTVSRPEFEIDPETAKTSSMHDSAVAIFEEAGLVQYSLTEFAKQGKQCRYVRACFDGSDVLPIGPSAFGRSGNEVWDNSPYSHLFAEPDFGREHDRAIILRPVEAFKRDVLLGMWLLEVDLDLLCSKHNVVVSEQLFALLTVLETEKWIAFDGARISLLPTQRFFAGVPMARLAELDAKFWCVNETLDIGMNGPVEPTKVVQRHLELNSVIRMARRDPAFFMEVNRSPESTLRNIGLATNTEEMAMLINAINGSNTATLSEDEVQLAILWRLVEKEHLRGRKAREIAGIA
jgi:oxygen-independent coproporphyrinogen-3 oxidase